MVTFTYQKKAPAGDKLGALVLFFAEGELNPPEGLPPALARVMRQAVQLGEFGGKSGQTQFLLTSPQSVANTVPRLLLIGLGPPDKLDREALRRAAGRAGQQLNKLNLERAGLWMPAAAGAAPAAELAEVLTEGALLGAYTFNSYKEKRADAETPKAELKHLTLYDPAGGSSAESMHLGVLRGEAVNLARNLGNQPPNAMTPTQLAVEARDLAKRRGLKVKVLERADMERLGMGMFLGVAKGSREPPKLIVLEYRPRKKSKHSLVFVGKGITFDSGGISLKPGAAMDEMKFDMCGAAAVMGAMEGIGRLKPAVNVVGMIPACENLPDGGAVKPGDILKSYTGKHVEVLNTDAEGRLILGDALAYGIERYKPHAVIDLATLTGACVIALGHYATGAVGNNEPLMDKVVQAGRASGDIVWPLPNFPEYEESLQGKYGDLQNIGTKEGGAITGGLFLKNFVGEVPWAHLDIAGTAWGVKNIGHIPNEGATGVGVCLLMDLVLAWNGLS